MPDDKTDLQILLHKKAIEEVLLRYCRGIDRCDMEILKTVFWEDSVVDYGKLGGAALEFFTTVISTREETNVTHHQIATPLIEVDGERARAESYVTAYHFMVEDGEDMDMLAGGRYLDTFAQRDGEWRILSRLFIMDWNQNLPSSARWHEGVHAQVTHRGAHVPDDGLYSWLGKKIGDNDR